MAEIHRITIQLSSAEMRNLIRWSKWHGRPKATYASQIIAARLEANVNSIRDLMEEQARYENITIEELDQRWLSEENFYQSGEEVPEA